MIKMNQRERKKLEEIRDWIETNQRKMEYAFYDELWHKIHNLTKIKRR